MQIHASKISLALLFSLTAAAIAIAVPVPHLIDSPSLPPRTSHLAPHILGRSTPLHSLKRRDYALKIANLPDGYTGIFTTFASISPKLPATATFIKFFQAAAALAAKDPSPGRHHQRFRYGALALELVALEQSEAVSREILQAVSLWLLDAAAKGWTGFFRAWVTDVVDNEVIEIRLATIFDMPAADNWAIEP